MTSANKKETAMNPYFKVFLLILAFVLMRYATEVDTVRQIKNSGKIYLIFHENYSCTAITEDQP